MEHSHSHNHEHKHDHSGIFHTHAPAGKMKQAFFLAIIILISEIVFGIISNSMALLADAWHMATDVAAIGLSWFALVQAKKPPNKKMTFGYERAGILAAAINGLTLVAITIWILYSAIGRIIHPEPVTGLGMSIFFKLFAVPLFGHETLLYTAFPTMEEGKQVWRIPFLINMGWAFFFTMAIMIIISMAGPKVNPKAFALDKQMFKLKPSIMAMIVGTLLILAAIYIKFW